MSLRVPRSRLTGGVWDGDVVARISCRNTGHINPSICDKRKIDVVASPTEQVSRLSRDERLDVRSIHPDMPSVTLRDPKVRGLHMVRPRVGDAPVDTRLVAAAAATATTHRNASANHDRDEQAVRFHGCLLHTSERRRYTLPTGSISSPDNFISLDASGGKLMQPLPSSQRNFATVADFVAFLQQNLNATPIYDDSGNVVGASGGLMQIGRTYYVDANYQVQPITDPISAFIGGIGAQFTVAGPTYSTGVQGQDYIVTPPTDLNHCNSAVTECLSEHSWNTHAIAHVRDTVGVEVNQESGGYQEGKYFCWKGPCPFCIPWICTSHSGSNLLTLEGSFFYDPPEVGVDIARKYAISKPQQNTTGIAFSKWSVCFGFGCGGQSDAQILFGACQQGTESSMPSYGATRDGRVMDLYCSTSAITCKSGYTYCGGPNLVCAQLQTDPLNCTACGQQCPAGWSCSSGCVPPPPPPPPPPDPPPPTCREKTCNDGSCVCSTCTCF